MIVGIIVVIGWVGMMKVVIHHKARIPESSIEERCYTSHNRVYARMMRRNSSMNCVMCRYEQASRQIGLHGNV
jgi:hypothetical protein